MGMSIEVFDYYARSMFPSILANLKDDESVSHEAFKVNDYLIVIFFDIVIFNCTSNNYCIVLFDCLVC